MRPRRRLHIESLEDRTVPAVHTWTGGAGNGLWSDAGNWTGGAPTTLEALPEGTVVEFPADNSASVQDIAGLQVDQIRFLGTGNQITVDDALTLVGDRLPVQLISDVGSNTITPLAAGSDLILGGTSTVWQVDSYLGVFNRVRGSASVVKSGFGVLYLSGAGTDYSGGTTLRTGTIDWGTATALGTGPVIIGDAGSPPNTLTFLRGNATATLPNDITVNLLSAAIGSTGASAAVGYSGTITMNLPRFGTVYLLAGSPQGVTFSGRLTGTADVVVYSPEAPGRSIILDNATGTPNDVHRIDNGTGTFTIDPDAVLEVRVDATKRQFPNPSVLIFRDTTSTLLLANPAGTGGAETIDYFNGLVPGAGQIRTASPGAFTLTIGGTLSSTTFTGSLTDGVGTLSLVKSGLHPAFFGDVAISGTALVNDGWLVVGGTFATSANPAIRVSGTGTLIGDGIVGGRVVVESGGTLEPGAGFNFGLLTASGVTMQAGSTFLVDSSGGPPAADFGALRVLGPVDLGGANLEIAAPIGNNLVPGTSAIIVDNDGTDPITGTFASLPEGTVFVRHGISYRISYVGGDGNDVSIRTPIPLSLIPPQLNRGTVGAAFSQTIIASGTPGPFTYSVTGGSLPPGLALSAGGSLTGTPTNNGAFAFTIMATDGLDDGSRDYTLTVDPAPIPISAGGGSDGTAFNYLPNANGSYTLVSAASPFGGGEFSSRTAVGDLNGDRIPDTVFVTGPGVPIRMAAISGKDGTRIMLPIDPFGGDFTGGGFVACADLDGDGRSEFIVTPDQGGGPRVSIFTLLASGGVQTRASFFGIDDANFRGGARPALGDVNRDGIPDLLVAAGFGGGPRVALFSGATIFSTRGKLVNDFFAFPEDASTLRNGIFPALGDISGDGFADLVFGGGPGGGPRILILSGQLLMAGSPNLFSQPVANFFVEGNSKNRGGVHVAAKDADRDAKADLVVGSGEGAIAKVRVYLGKNFSGTGEPGVVQDLVAFGSETLPGGVFVG